MTRKKRTLLLILISLACIFTIIPVIFYSLGWRIDSLEKRIIRAGSFYFRIWPRGVDISLVPIYKDKEIEEELIEKKTLFNTIYIENILPKEYGITVKKDGFYSFEKRLDINPGGITELKNITLVKKNPYFGLISEKVDKFYISPNEKGIVFIKGREINLYNLQTNRQQVLARTSSEVEDLLFFPDSERILLKTKSDWLLLIIETLSLTPVSFGIKEPVKKEEIIFDPKNRDVIYLLKNGSFYKKNLFSEKTEVISKDILSVLVLENENIYLDNKGFVTKNNLEKEKINETPLEINSSNYDILIIDSIFYIKENDKLYRFNPEEEKFDHFLDSIEQIKVSNDKGKTLFAGNHEIRIFFQKQQYDQPQREKEEIIFLSRFSEKIKEIYWWTDHYLIFALSDKIKIMEIDNRNKINIFDLAEFKEPEIFWSKINRKLFVLSEGFLYISESLIF